MKLFVDYMDPQGEYCGAGAACTVDPSLPIGVLTAVVFLNAVGQGEGARTRRVFHVEGGRFLPEDTLEDCDVGDLDTLIIVNTDDLALHVATKLLTSWWTNGGAARRCPTYTPHQLRC